MNTSMCLLIVLGFFHTSINLLSVQELVVKTSQGNITVWDSQGTGPAVMLIHGNSVSGKIFEKQFTASLGKKYRLLAPDLPGHGKSDVPQDIKVYSLPGYAKILTEVIQKLGLSDVAIVGWALGGHIALEMSLLLPNVKGILITGAPPIQLTAEGIQKGFKPFEGFNLLGHPEKFTRDQAILFMTLGGINMTSSDTEFIIQDIMNTDGLARAHMFASTSQGIGNDETAIVRTMHIPLAVIAGENDGNINNDYIAHEVQYSTLWENKVHFVNNAGHSVFWENAEAFNELTEKFLNNIYKLDPTIASRLLF